MPSAAYLKAIASRMHQAGSRPILKVSDQLEAGQPLLGLTSPQKFILRAQALSNDPSAYVIAVTLELIGPLDTVALDRSVRDLYNIHPALRGYVSVGGAAPVQGFVAPCDIPRLKSATCKDANRARLRAQSFTLPADHRKDLRAFAAKLFLTEGSTHYLALRFHHVFVDGLSLKIIARDLNRLYSMHASAIDSAESAPVAVSYFDWVVTEQVNAAAGGSPGEGGPPLIRWGPTGDLRLPQGEDLRTTVTLDQATSAALDAIGRCEKVTGAAVWLAAAAVLSAGLCNSSTVAIQILTQGRYRGEIAECVGCFTTPVVVQVDVSPKASFADIVLAADDALAAAIAAPLDRTPEESISVSLIYRRANERPTWKLRDLTVNELATPRRSARAPLQIGVIAATEATELRFELGRAFTDGLQRCIPTTFASICRNIAKDRTQSVGATWVDAALMRAGVKAPVALGELTHSRAKFIEILHTLAVDNGPTTAIVGLDEQMNSRALTYSDVVAMAHLAAHRLRLAIGFPDACGVVGVEARNGAEYLISCLAIVFAGLAFKPLPIARLRPAQNATSVGCDKVVIFSEMPLLSSDDSLIHYSDLVSEVPSTDSSGWSEIPVAVGADDLNGRGDPAHDVMCFITTSGSTGEPKEVPVSYSAVMNRLRWMWHRYPTDEGETALVRTSPMFVDSLWEMFGPLLAGIPAVTLFGSPNYSLRRLAESISRFTITRLSITPSLLRELLQWTDGTDVLQSVRVMIVSGELLPGQVLAHTQRQMPTAVVLNLYGSTETAGDATTHECTELDAARHFVPVGLALPGVVTFVVDEQNRPMLPGMHGEILIAGRCLTPVPTTEKPGSWLRSGDLGYVDHDGILTVTGRCDDLVKVNGIRVCLTSVEREIRQLSGGILVRVVLDRTGNLIAVYERGGLTEASIRKINARLADVHRPTWRCVEHFPRTATGKVSRTGIQRLADEGCTDVPTDAARLEYSQKSRAPTEEDILRLVHTMKDGHLLEVAPDENLVRAGLNSMDIVRLIGLIERQFDARIDPERIFSNPTVSVIASQAGGA